MFKDIVKSNGEKYRIYGIQCRDGYHEGTDIGADVGESVFSDTDGIVHELTGLHDGYGSLNPSKPGGVCFIKSQDASGSFIVQYGHINLEVKPGDIVRKGQRIGTVADFTNNKIKCSHVHVGVWLGLDLPANHWGYVTDASQKGKWIDPEKKLI